MAKKSLLKKCVSLTMAVLMTVSAFILALPAADAAAAKVNQEANPAPRKTIIRTANVGGCSDGVYSVTENGIFTIRGTGDYFDATAGGKDKYYYVYMLAQGSTVVTAKITPDAGATAGYSGVLARNGAKAKDYAAGVYFDYGRQELMAASRGGATAIAPMSKGDSKGAFYVKLEFSANSMYYTVATDANFTDIVKGRTYMGCSGLNYNNVGFFSTMSTTFTVSDVNVSSQYTDSSGNAVKKVVYDYKTGEFIPTLSKSSDYSGTYASDFTFTTSVSGNKLNMVSTRAGSTASKGDIKQAISTDYLLFPEYNANLTISADVTINSIDTGNTKQGVGIGQFCVEDIIVNKAQIVCSFLHACSSKWTQHSFTTNGGTTNVGYPRSSTISINSGTTYKLSYTRGADGKAVMNTYDAAGKLIGDGGAKPFTLSGTYVSLQADGWVQYGIAVSAADVSIANLTLTTSDGWIIYDQNDYYNTVELETDKEGGQEEEVEADYSDVDDAIKNAPTNLELFTEESAAALTKAINAVVRGKKASEQAVVDGYAKAINDAVAALVPKPQPVRNGLVYNQEFGKWYYYVNDEINVSYTGLLQNGGAWWYIVNGVLQDSYKGIVENSAGKWYVSNGKINTSYTGLGEYKGEWYCVQAGKVNMNYTGAVKNAGVWWYIRNGKLDTSYTGLLENESVTWFVKNGKVNTDFTGFSSDGTDYWYVKSGKVDTGYTGLAQSDGVWWYVVNGKIAKDYKGIVENSEGKWYVSNGKINTSYTGLGEYKGEWYCVQAGKVNMNYTGAVKNAGVWWYIRNGKLDTSYTGLLENESVTWFVKNGKVNTDFTGFSSDGTDYWYVNGGKVNTSYTGIVESDGIRWYVVNGKIASNYTGQVEFDGKTWNIQNGKVNP